MLPTPFVEVINTWHQNWLNIKIITSRLTSIALVPFCMNFWTICHRIMTMKIPTKNWCKWKPWILIYHLPALLTWDRYWRTCWILILNWDCATIKKSRIIHGWLILTGNKLKVKNWHSNLHLIFISHTLGKSFFSFNKRYKEWMERKMKIFNPFSKGSLTLLNPQVNWLYLDIDHQLQVRSPIWKKFRQTKIVQKTKWTWNVKPRDLSSRNQNIQQNTSKTFQFSCSKNKNHLPIHPIL